jgi:hypothetical protein
MARSDGDAGSIRWPTSRARSSPGAARRGDDADDRHDNQQLDQREACIDSLSSSQPRIYKKRCPLPGTSVVRRGRTDLLQRRRARRGAGRVNEDRARTRVLKPALPGRATVCGTPVAV